MPVPPGLPEATTPFRWPWRADGLPLLMGIVNATPDSFSDGGHYLAAEAALAQGARLAAEGADLLDIGGESTRPGADPVPMDEEIARVQPVVAGLAGSGLPLSIDTYKAGTARAALAAGARIVNDVWGLQRDPGMAEAVAEAGAGLVVMHNRTEKDAALDIVADALRFFERALELAWRAGIAPERIVLDPGIGFGKTQEQNLAAIRAAPAYRALGCRLLLGVSRKSFLGVITGREVGERGAATLAANLIGAIGGYDVLRVHEIAPHFDARAMLGALPLPLRSPV